VLASASTEERGTASAEPLAAMEADGIDMSSLWVEYFDEVGPGEPAHE
jgi:hypothetical protein